MRKIIRAIVVVAAVLGSAFAFSACSDGGHTEHDFSGSWVTTDPEYHWHVCAAEGCDETDTKVAHDWVDDESKTDVPATCIADGIHYSKCSVCGKEKSEAITDRPDHSFTGAGWVTTDPEYHWHVCATEGCDEIDTKGAHDWVDDESKPDKPATCIADGIHYSKCSVCGKGKSEPLTDRPGHDFTGALKYTDETGHYHVCTTEGCEETDTKVAHVCDKYEKVDDNVHSKACECGYSENEAHNWDEGVVTKEPSENEKGIRTYTCEDCHTTKTEVIPETSHSHTPSEDWANDENSHWHTCAGCTEKLDEADHSWVDDESKTDVPVTCHSDGIHYVKCSVCGKEKSEAVTDRPDHDFTGALVTTDPDYHYHVCTNEGCGETDEKVAHSWNEGEVTKQPTFWEEGEKTFACACGKTKTEAIEKLNTVNNAEGFDASNTATGEWHYGKIDIGNWDNLLADNNTLTQATDKNGGGDGWTIDGKEVKAGWMSGSCIYVSFTAKEAVTLKVEIEVKRTSHMEGETKVDNKRFDVRTQIDGDSGARYHGAYDDNGVMKFTEEYTLEAGETLYMVFTSKGEDSGFEQADYSIKISRPEQLSD